MWRAFLAADFLWKAACKVRPYEMESGGTDRVVAEEITSLARILEERGDIRPAFAEAVRRVASIPVKAAGTRPLVGVVGEIYVRCNPFSNDHVIRAIERYGGEAWLAPTSEWIIYTAALQQWRARSRPLHLPQLLAAYLKNQFILREEHEFQSLAAPFLDDRREPDMKEILAEGRRFVPMNFAGESILTLGRAVHFARGGAALIVNVAPFGCMPGTITSALCREIQAQTRVPIVSLFYDGEPGMNQRLEVFLASLVHRQPAR